MAGRAASSVRHVIINGIEVEITRKRVKWLRVVVQAPDGRVRISAPLRASEFSIHALIQERADWIRSHQARLRSLPRPSELQYVDGELHDFLGAKRRLIITSRTKRGSVKIVEGGAIELSIRADASRADRERAMRIWYRAELAKRIPAMLDKWQPKVGIPVASWRVRAMRSRWGSCHPRERRIALSLELAKKSVECIEYVLVHELAHLLEASHNARFYRIMTRLLPEWQSLRKQLNGAIAGDPEPDGNGQTRLAL